MRLKDGKPGRRVLSMRILLVMSLSACLGTCGHNPAAGGRSKLHFP
jgi:hypothetical protein